MVGPSYLWPWETALEGIQLIAKGEFVAEAKLYNLDVVVSIQELVFCL